jgi:hypothetical protein
MDPADHISIVNLFHSLIGAISLTDEEKAHLTICGQCKESLEELLDRLPEVVGKAA